MNEEKPDGYVVRVPQDDDGYRGKFMTDDGEFGISVFPSPEAAIHELKSDVYLQEDYERASATHDHRLNNGLDFLDYLRQRGYGICPVKLVFLDE